MATIVSKLENSPGAAILAYCFSSMSMTLVNKYVVSGPEWNLNFFYLAVQAVVGTLAIVSLNQFGLMGNLEPFDSRKARAWFPISVLLVGMIYTSIQALQFLTVPVYTIFKNLTIIVIAYSEALWFGGRVTPLDLLAFGLMVLSSVTAAWADIQSVVAASSKGSLQPQSVTMSSINAGYYWMGLNIFCSAAYALSNRKIMVKANLKSVDVMFYNNLLSIPVLLAFSGLVEDWSKPNVEKNFPVASRNSLFSGMVYSGLVAILISYCTPWCIRTTSSTTYAMVGALNKLPLAILGIIFFAAPVTLVGNVAIFIGFVSGIIFTWSKNRKVVAPEPVLPTTNRKD